jgi:iron complex outermembrane receptor protein
MVRISIGSLGLLLGLVCLSVAWPASAAAQGGSIAGTVEAPDGTRVPLASLRAEHRRTGAIARAASSDLGVFFLGDVPVGTYALVVVAPGFAETSIEAVEVTAGAATTVRVLLQLAAIEESVTVVGAAPRDSLETASIRESAARDVGEALAANAGVNSLRKGGIASDVVLRGLQGRDVTVLVDGQRVYGACPNRMDPAAFHVDFAEVDRVEIGKGPFDVRNQGSLGGLVNVVTRRPESGWHATPSLSAGSFGYVNPAVTMAYGGRPVSVLAGASFRRSLAFEDGNGVRFTERANYRTSAVDAEAFRVGSGWARATWAPAAAHRVETAYARQEAEQVLYPYLMMDAEYDNTDRLRAEYQASSGLGPFATLMAQGYVTRVDHWMTDELRVSSLNMARAYSMGTIATTETVGGRLEASATSATIGLEAYRRRWDASTEMAGMRYAPQHSIPDAATGSVGLFGEVTRGVRRTITVTAGGRIDRVHAWAHPSPAELALYYAYKNTRTTSRTDLLPSGKARVSWAPGSGAELAVGVGHSARVAEANEQFMALKRSGGDWVGNPDLTPSRHTAIDAHASLNRPRWSATGNAYWGRVHGYIAVHNQTKVNMVAGVMNARARSYANVDATLAGGELEATTHLSSRVFLSGDLSLVRGSKGPVPSLGITSDVLAEMPPARARLRLRFDDGRWFAAAEGVLVAEQDRVDVDLGEAPTPGYAVANLHGGVRRGALSATLGVANLFDRAYAEHLSYQRDPFRTGVRVNEPGRQVYANLSWRF